MSSYNVFKEIFLGVRTCRDKFVALIKRYHIRFLNNPPANGAKRRSGRKPGARVTNFALAELKVVARGMS